MTLSTKLLAALSAVLLLAACETAPSTTGDASGGGAGDGAIGSGVEGGTGTLPGTDIADRVFFDLDSSVIRADGQDTLKRQAEWLNKNSSASINIEGHCDERGTREYNIALGERRASAVKNYLTSLGVDAARISVVSYGKERPAVAGSSEDSWAQNRRGVTVVSGN